MFVHNLFAWLVLSYKYTLLEPFLSVYSVEVAERFINRLHITQLVD